VELEKLKKKYVHAAGAAKQFWTAYQRAAEYAAPSINTFGQSDGHTKQPNVATSQPLRSTNAFICEFISSLTPPNRRWAELKPTNSLIEKIASSNSAADINDIEQKLNLIYENITNKFFECLDASNFYAVLKQFVLSIGIGTGCLLISDVEPGPQTGNRAPFEFIHVPVSQLSLDTGANGRIYGVFRDILIRREEISLLWPDANLAALADGDDFQLVECCVYDPRSPNDPEPWAFCVFDSRQEIKLVGDRRLPYNPYVVFRWSVVEGESMGRGPILEAMADINALNRLWGAYYEWIERYGLGVTLVKNSEFAFGCYMGESNQRDSFEFRTGKVMAVNDPANYVPLRTAGEMSAQQFLIEELTQGVRHQLLDIELPAENTMTAYETQQRAARILRLMAGLIGRINLELIEPFFRVGLRLMHKYGIIQIPDSIGDITSFTTKITLQSPLSRSQQLADVEAARVALETLNLVQSPIAMQYVNMDEFVRFVWDGSGAPAKLLNTPEQAKAVQQATIQQQIMMEQAKRGNLEGMENVNGTAVYP
jgi:hypothetical protein